METICNHFVFFQVKQAIKCSSNPTQVEISVDFAIATWSVTDQHTISVFWKITTFIGSMLLDWPISITRNTVQKIRAKWTVSWKDDLCKCLYALLNNTKKQLRKHCCVCYRFCNCSLCILAESIHIGLLNKSQKTIFVWWAKKNVNKWNKKLSTKKQTVESTH